MRMYDLIMKKRNGEKLSQQEIEFMVMGYTKGEIPDYQMSAMMMAIYFRGMDAEETLQLTLAMERSGDVLDLSHISGCKVDKHSTGGVGDKTSLALTPMVAACGVKIAKMSGRGLGHTGGTIDKLESIPGFSTEIDGQLFEKNVEKIGISIMGQTKDLAPADKKLYALRDVTATVDNISLIASSIMSKKLACGADAIVLDVKSGSGAFMKNEEDAKALATAMTEIGNGAGRKTIAVISNMDQPLGNAIGNALEVMEAIETLKGNGPEDFTNLCMELGSHMLIAGGKADSKEDAQKKLKQVIEDGSALDKLATFIKAQGGDESFVYHPEKFKLATIQKEIPAKEAGYISQMICDEIGICSLILGGGRASKEDTIDLSVGFILHKKVGDAVAEGDSIATIYANDEKKLAEAVERFYKAVSIAKSPVSKQTLIKAVIS